MTALRDATPPPAPAPPRHARLREPAAGRLTRPQSTATRRRADAALVAQWMRHLRRPPSPR